MRTPPPVCLRALRFKDRFLPCVTNTLVTTRQGRRFAQAALKLCGSLEQRRDLGICPTFIFLNADIVVCRTSTPLKSRQWGRHDDCDRSNLSRLGAQ